MLLSLELSFFLELPLPLEVFVVLICMFSVAATRSSISPVSVVAVAVEEVVFMVEDCRRVTGLLGTTEEEEDDKTEAVVACRSASSSISTSTTSRFT